MLGVVAGIYDQWGFDKTRLVGVVCALGFGGGLIFTTGAGLYWLDVIDHYVTFLALPFVGLVQCLLVARVLKTRTLRDHANEVSDLRIGRWWEICIGVVTPVLLGAMFMLLFACLVFIGGLGVCFVIALRNSK